MTETLAVDEEIVALKKQLQELQTKKTALENEIVFGKFTEQEEADLLTLELNKKKEDLERFRQFNQAAQGTSSTQPNSTTTPVSVVDVTTWAWDPEAATPFSRPRAYPLALAALSSLGISIGDQDLLAKVQATLVECQQKAQAEDEAKVKLVEKALGEDALKALGLSEEAWHWHYKRTLLGMSTYSDEFLASLAKNAKAISTTLKFAGECLARTESWATLPATPDDHVSALNNAPVTKYQSLRVPHEIALALDDAATAIEGEI